MTAAIASALRRLANRLDPPRLTQTTTSVTLYDNGRKVYGPISIRYKLSSLPRLQERS